MSVEHKPTPKIFVAASILVTILSTTTVVFAALHGPVGGRPHGPAQNSRRASSPAHSRHVGHPAPWFMDATFWAVSVANRIAGA